MNNQENLNIEEIIHPEQSTKQESDSGDFSEIEEVRDFISFDDLLTNKIKLGYILFLFFFQIFIQLQIILGRAQYLTYLTIIIVWIAEGTELVFNPLLNLALKQSESWGISESQQNLLTSGLFLGFLIGAFPSGYFGDRFGRRKSLLWILILMTLFGVASGFSWNIYVLIFFRFAFGIFIGLGIPIVVTLTAEITPMNFRGKLLVITVAFFVIGELIVVGFAYGFFSTIENAKWQEMLIALQSFKLLGVYLCWQFCLESPRYLFYIGKTEEAIKVTNYYIKANNEKKINKKSIKQEEDTNMIHECLSDKSSEDFRLELTQDEINQILEWCKLQKVITAGEQQNQSSWKLFLDKYYLIITLKMIVIWFSLTIAYYGTVYSVTTILDEKYGSGSSMSAEDKKNKQFTELLISTAIEMPSYIGSAYLIEKSFIGRKKIMIAGFAVAIFASIIICTYRDMSETLFTVLVSVARFFFSATFVTIQPYTAEIYPTSIRNKGYGLLNGSSRFGGILLLWILDLFYEIDYTGPYILFAILSLVSLILLFFLPETQGTELDTLKVQKADLADVVKSIRKSIAQSFKESQI